MKNSCQKLKCTYLDLMSKLSHLPRGNGLILDMVGGRCGRSLHYRWMDSSTAVLDVHHHLCIGEEEERQKEGGGQESVNGVRGIVYTVQLCRARD